MPDLNEFLRFLPVVLTTVAVALTLMICNWLLRRGSATGEMSVTRQLFMLLVTALGVLVIIFALPIGETSRGQVLSLIGIVVTAVIALSSTTFVANIMAGLMLRAVNSFRPGDFVRCETYFGRVTERGLFHTEIQTEDRDLATLPNLYLVTNPVTVVHTSGTIISAELSLGYDVPHGRVEELLIRAAELADLKDAFMLVVDLGDHAVLYRVGGYTEDINRLLTVKSTLRRKILTVMHENGIEIVSPAFMNQRQLDPDSRMIPSEYRDAIQSRSSPEEVMFDKADSAAAREALKESISEAEKELASLTDSGLSETAETEKKSQIDRRIALLRQELEASEKEGV